MKKPVCVGLFLCGIAGSGMAFAECPISMPEQLLTDCIVNEDAGHNFPPSDYAYMDMYQDWVKTQQSKQVQSDHEEGSVKSESILHVRLPVVH